MLYLDFVGKKDGLLRWTAKHLGWVGGAVMEDIRVSSLSAWWCQTRKRIGCGD